MWAADDRRLGRSVAVKLVSPEAASRPGVVERFRREALAAGGLVHPNITQVFDSGRDERTYFIVMELLEGGSLRDLLSVRTLDQTEASLVGRAVALALSYAHSKGILHRDVKPSNVLFTQTGFPKLSDFGIARSLDPGYAEPTAAGEIVGTLSYMAPEQISGDAVTEATDIYSLGLLLFEAVAGENPRSGGGPAELTARASKPLPPIQTKVLNLDSEIALLIDKCLSVDPSSRPTAASEVAGILSSHCRGRTELDLAAFGRPGEATTTVTPALPPSKAWSGPSSLPTRSPAPDLVAAAPVVATQAPPETAPAGAAIGRPLTGVVAGSLLRLAVGIAVSAAFAWIGYRLGGDLSAFLSRLLLTTIPFLRP